MKTTFETLKEIFIELSCTANEVTPEAKLEDLWPDEVAQTEITLHIEDQFDVEVSEEEIDKLATVSDLVALIDQKNADAMEDPSYG
jgi:acyl carrier protein